MKKAGRHTLYGNQNGLPGLPKTSYITRKPVRQTPRLPPQPTAAPRPAPAPRPVYQPMPMQQAPPPQQPLMPAGPDPFVTRRMDMLEQRLNSSEQSNRALMDDLMRLQQDMKMQIKKNEMGLNEERESKGRMEIAMRQSQGHQYELDERIRRNEEGVKENRAAIQQLIGQLQSVEKLNHSLQQEQSEKASQGNSKISEYRHEMMKMTQETEQLERYCTSLREDNRLTQNQLETVKRDLLSLQSNVKLQARLLEDNAAAPKPAAKSNDTTRMGEAERLVLEGKIAGLNNTIQDLSSRLSSEAKKREKVENGCTIRMNEMQEEFGKTKLEKDKELRDVDDKLKELQAGFSQAEKQRILNEINSVANDLQRKMEQKEVKLRDDTVNKLTVIEKTLSEESKRRHEEEKMLNDKVDKQIKQMELKEQGSSNDLKKVFDKHEVDTRERVGDLTKRMNEVEDALRNHRLENDRVLTAEINERENQDKIVDGKVEDLEHRLALGLANLQSTIGEMKQQPKSGSKGDKAASSAAAAEASADRMKELEEMQKKNEDSIREQLAKEVGSLDKRLQNVETSVKQQEDKIDSQLQAAQKEDQDANDQLGNKMQTQIDSVAFKQKKLEKQVEDLKESVQDTPKGLENIRKDLEEVEAKMDKRVDVEVKDRREADEELRDDIDKILGRKDVTVPSLAQVQTDVEATQTGMKKLAEAVHVVKTSLMDRIRDEKKLREQETTILKRDVERLDTKYHDIKETIKAGDVLDPDYEDDYGYT